MLGALEIDLHIEVFPDLGLHVRHCFDQRQFIHRLRVVGHRTVRVDRDRHWPHAQKSKRHQSEREHCWRQHSRRQSQAHRAHVIGNRHQNHHGETEIVPGEVARHESRQDSQRGSAFLCGDHHFFHVPRLHRRERFHQFRNQRTCQRPARNDGRKLPPLRTVSAKGRNDEVRNQVG